MTGMARDKTRSDEQAYTTVSPSACNFIAKPAPVGCGPTGPLASRQGPSSPNEVEHANHQEQADHRHISPVAPGRAAPQQPTPRRLLPSTNYALGKSVNLQSCQRQKRHADDGRRQPFQYARHGKRDLGKVSRFPPPKSILQAAPRPAQCLRRRTINVTSAARQIATSNRNVQWKTKLHTHQLRVAGTMTR